MTPAKDAERADRLRLIRSQNVGPETFHALLARFGSARAALAALPDLAAAGGRRGRIRVAGVAEVEHEAARAKRLGVDLLHHGDPDYPPRLAAIDAPPPVLTVRGDVAVLHRRAVAVVGARAASAAGRTFARRLAEAFGEAGRVVVSGLARGIDAEAHRAAIATGTVAVLAGGVDRPTPPANLDLADAIAASGALVSEMPLGTDAAARLFVRRNRLIAGLADGVVVVEAAVRSGSLHTANFATAAGREVFAVPGSPLDPRAAGCLRLLKDGATLVVEPRDVLDALGDVAVDVTPPGVAESAIPLEPGSRAIASVREALSVTPVAVDELVRATGLAPGEVLASLVELELAGHAEREAGGLVRVALAGWS
ncbi:DNA-processing protein DprA [Acuticoccus sp.]|uniref:DNA-processing protein DprA n=1 Tax=Acuticoccus sp. TaxID=1904378 RepID=UPI003B51E595